MFFFLKGSPNADLSKDIPALIKFKKLKKKPWTSFYLQNIILGHKNLKNIWVNFSYISESFQNP